MTEPSAGQKSADAYRTISEVADELVVPQHVLRFWETRFPQVKPLKRAGGRRFYRPDDVALLRAVRALLYDEGYTIKGVQRLLTEHGARHVAEALARSRTIAAGPAAPTLPAIGGPKRETRAGSMPEPRPDVQVQGVLAPLPAPAAPRGPVPLPPPVPPPAPVPVDARDARDAAGGADVAGRVGAVLADLVECARLLASVRST